VKKRLSIFLIVFVLIFLSACTDPTISTTTPGTVPPDAVEPLETLAEMAKTADLLFATVTEAYKTPTPTPTSTPSPNAEKAKELLNDAIQNDLEDAFGLGGEITLLEFSSSPDTLSSEGDNPYKYIVIHMECKSNGGKDCASAYALVNLMNACKANKKKAIKYMPHDAEYMLLKIFHPEDILNPQVVYDVNWEDVQSYLEKDLSADEFREKVRRFLPVP